MVSLNQKIDVNVIAKDDKCLSAVVELLNGKNIGLSENDALDVRSKLLLAVSHGKESDFLKIGKSISNRTISADADWCHDDFLLFLLILGNQKFGRPFDFIERVVEARRNNTNPLAQKINEVFSALYRQDFAISGELGFLKIPFLQLVGSTHLDASEAKVAFDALSDSDVIEQFSPFFKVMAVKAYDFILFSRSNFEIETATQLVSLVRREADNLSLKNLWDIILCLPLKLIASIIIILLFFSVSLYSGVIWIKSAYKEYSYNSIGNISILSVGRQFDDLPSGVRTVASEIMGRYKDDIFVIKSDKFTGDKKGFVAELSHTDAAISEIFAFVQESDKGIRPFTVLPFQKDGVRARFFLPESISGSQLVVITTLKRFAENEDAIDSDNFILRVD